MTDYSFWTVAEFLAAGGSITPPDPDPDAEWKELLKAFLQKYRSETNRLGAVDDAYLTALKHTVPLSPPYRELEKRLEEAVGLLEQHDDTFDNSEVWAAYHRAVDSFLTRYKEQSNG